MSTEIPDDLIRQPDGSYVSLAELEPRRRLAHEAATKLFPQAVDLQRQLAKLKKLCFTELNAFRDMMLDDYSVKVGGPQGGISVKSVCGTMKVALEVSKHTTFGPELEAAKLLIDEYIDEKLVGSSEEIRAIVGKAFQLNSKGRLDTQGILDLRVHKFEDPTWMRAMVAIEDAICRDSSTTYVRFYEVDVEEKSEDMISLNMAKV